MNNPNRYMTEEELIDKLLTWKDFLYVSNWRSVYDRTMFKQYAEEAANRVMMNQDILTSAYPSGDWVE